MMLRSVSLLLCLVLGLATESLAFSASSAFRQRSLSETKTARVTSLFAVKEKQDVEEITEKYGLEAGLATSIKEKDGESAKSLLKKYGIAYLATSIPLAIVSFTICYVLVDNGVDVGSLLAKIGIQGDNQEKAGTFALAYGFHKAASPIRFPPTVVLTPFVAKLIGKEPESNDDTEGGMAA